MKQTGAKLNGLARVARLLAAIVLNTVLLYSLARSWGSAPPLGRWLDPVSGAWAVQIWPKWLSAGKPSWTGRALWASDRVLKVQGLKSKVIVRADREGVKRIFAESDEDLYFAQGFVTASDRLWQMDFVYRLAAGRLAEVTGPRSLPYDLMFRKFGLPQAAEESAEAMLQDPLTREPLIRYAEGVNAYVATLAPASLPFEFKLLDYKPEKWTPERTAYLVKFMAFNLAAHSRDLPLTRSEARVSPDDFADLFPLDVPTPEPIVPKGRKWGFHTLAPEPPKQPFRANLALLDPMPTPHPSNGSNNWAVAGRKSTTGKPIISNDIHLDYGLPSLWYEIQLSSPTQSVYGASLPGSPGVVLGFNRDLAWATTNGGSDVLDWYELRFRDEKRNEYLHEGEWRPVIAKESEIKIKGAAPVKITLRRTHYGPIVYDESEQPLAPWIARALTMRWAPLEPSNEVKAFLSLNRGRSLEGCHEAISHFQWPDQNFLCVDGRNVGIWHNGKYPIRWRGQGRTVGDGSSRAFDWLGWLPREQAPSSVNPERGFLSSANQAPADATYPHYLGWPFEEPYRAIRINEALRAKEKHSPEDIMALQGDVSNSLAREVLPSLLATLSERSALTERQSEMVEVLAKWDFKHEISSVGATIFSAWWTSLIEEIWSEKFPDARQFARPPIWRTVELIRKDPESRHFDQLATPEKETLRDRARKAFQAAEARLVSERGDRVTRWTWGAFRPTDLPHLAKIPGLGRLNLEVGGDEKSVYANTGSHGPVWKSVVAIGAGIDGAPRAWSIYPGGQSGDPSSPLYDEYVDRWAKNELREIQFLRDSHSPLAGAAGTITMEAM